MTNSTWPNRSNNIEFEVVEPWESPVEPEELLNKISTTIQRFTTCDIETAYTSTLWTAGLIVTAATLLHYFLRDRGRS